MRLSLQALWWFAALALIARGPVAFAQVEFWLKCPKLLQVRITASDLNEGPKKVK